MKLLSVTFLSLLLSFQNVIAQNAAECKNLVPDKKTAIKVAEAVWLPIYGNSIKKKKPFVATLVNDIWQVRGTLWTRKGGVPYIEIQKCDCKVLKVTHSK